MATATAPTAAEIAIMAEEGRLAYHRGDLAAAAMNGKFRAMIEGCPVEGGWAAALAKAFSESWHSEHIKELMAQFPEMYA